VKQNFYAKLSFFQSRKYWCIFLAIFLISFFFIKPYSDIKNLKGKFLTTKDGHVLIVKERPSSWSSLREISPEVAHAIVISEDWAFYQHNGVDYKQIYHSIKDALFGKGLRGASTISQQLVKNIYFSHKRSYFRKVYELFYTLIMEWKFSKKEILEKYLNIIELGRDLYGVKNGSQAYFDLSVSSLNARQGAFLAMLLPSPVKYSESFKEKALTKYAQKTINNILDKMVMAKHINADDRDYYKQSRFKWEYTSESKEILDEDYLEYE